MRKYISAAVWSNSRLMPSAPPLGTTGAVCWMPTAAEVMGPDCLSARNGVCFWHGALCRDQICPWLSTSMALRLWRQAGTPKVSQNQVLCWGMSSVIPRRGGWKLAWRGACALWVALGSDGLRMKGSSAHGLHGSWDHFGFWSIWNTKDRGSSPQSQAWVWQGLNRYKW